MHLGGTQDDQVTPLNGPSHHLNVLKTNNFFSGICVFIHLASILSSDYNTFGGGIHHPLVLSSIFLIAKYLLILQI